MTPEGATSLSSEDLGEDLLLSLMVCTGGLYCSEPRTQNCEMEMRQYARTEAVARFPTNPSMPIRVSISAGVCICSNIPFIRTFGGRDFGGFVKVSSVFRKRK